MVAEFKIHRSWLKNQGTSEVDVTLARLQIMVNGHNVTEYSAEYAEDGDRLEIPAYYLAEWTAENWWPLLWEPRKNEDLGDDANFLARHSVLTAQHGFALPKILIVPIGRSIHISASPRDVQFADIRFRKGGATLLARSLVESELKKFVQATIDRLNEANISGTSLQDAWHLVAATSEDEKQFCQFMGALGLSPYAANEFVEDTLERLVAVLGERLVMDLCLAASADNFASVARLGEAAFNSMASAPTSTLEPLAAVTIPQDNPVLPAWRLGVQAANRARTKLGIDDADPHGGTKLLEKLKIDPSRKIQVPENTTDTSPIVGSVSRDALEAQIALLPNTEVQRRFAAGRAAYLAWSSEMPQERRFLTHAVTRGQQASRAFSAEMMAPVKYIRSQAKGGKLPQHRVFEIASNLNIGADVVQKQAINNGLQISPI